MHATKWKLLGVFVLGLTMLFALRWYKLRHNGITNQSKFYLAATHTVPFKNMLGINAFEWNFLQNPNDVNDGMHIYEPKMQLIKSFGGVRHYLDWKRIEDKPGHYTFSPTHNGGWNLDAMYLRAKTDGIDMLVCLKTLPDWLLDTYPANIRDPENVPIPYGANKALSASYVLQAKAAFQFAARYGYNKQIDKNSVLVDSTLRWTGDQQNQVKTGLALIKYIECDNERDKWWKGDKAQQSAAEYAANLSAFYDGHKGLLGKAVGVKNADPNMLVVMAGLAAPNPKYVEDIIAWCRQHRGYKADGSISLCFDVINYHFYANDHLQNSGDKATQGVAPELSEAAETAHAFVALGKKYKLPVWITEAGYDVNDGSPQRAIKIGNKNALITQADWIIRTALLYARCGIKKLFFYELYDDNLQNPVQYASSGFLTANLQRKPSALYTMQLKVLMGRYSYTATVNNNPLVDKYQYGKKVIYVLTSPSQEGSSVEYTLPLPGVKKAIIHRLNANSVNMDTTVESITNSSLKVTVTETPIFVELSN